MLCPKGGGSNCRHAASTLSYESRPTHSTGGRCGTGPGKGKKKIRGGQRSGMFPTSLNPGLAANPPTSDNEMDMDFPDC